MRVVDDWIEGFLQYTDNTEPPVSYREWVAVSVVASLLKRKCVLNLGTLTIYPNMYIVLVGPSGKARKGTAMNPGMKLLRETGKVRLAAEAITREALIRELDASSFTEPKATGGLNMHCSLTIYSQELTVFLGYSSQQLIADLTDWYDCRDAWTYRTKNAGENEIIGVWVNLIGATTPDLLQTTLPRDALGGGLLSRMIFVYEPTKGKIVPAPFITKEEVELRKRLVQDLDSIGMMSGEFKYDKGFLDNYIDWYTAQEGNPPFQDERFSGYFERRPTHILKLCTILSASRDSSMKIDKDILDRAIKLLGRTEIKMSNAFAGFGEADDSAVMSRIMTTIAITGSILYSALLDKYHYDVSKEQLSRILSTLNAMKFCRQEHEGTDTTIIYTKEK